jgi:predicted RNA polymerase sigma factor
MATTSPRQIHRRYAREKATIDHLVKECYEAKARNGAFTALEPRAANRSKNRFAKSGAQVRVDCQSSEPAFVKLLISADLQSMRPAGSSRLLPSGHRQLGGSCRACANRSG